MIATCELRTPLQAIRGQVEGMEEDEFVKIAEGAKSGCPVSQALAGTTITLDAALA